MRLRPIMMTSLAFGFGVLPLAIATGAGAGSQNAIGTGVLGGTIGATLLGLFFVIPLFYVVIKRIFPGQPKGGAVAPIAQEGRCAAQIPARCRIPCPVSSVRRETRAA